MKGLRSLSYYCYRRLFRETVAECVRGRLNGASYALKTMSHSTSRLENNLPQTKESPQEIIEFGGVTSLKEKPFLASGLADYADRSPILQELINLGVEIWKFNEDWNLCKFILRLDFKKNVTPYLSFLCKNGVQQEDLGQYLTENPYILQCDLDDLQVRINYLESKGFKKDMIAKIISGNPKWLSFEVKRIDSKLGDLQEMLKLKGNDVRSIAVDYPKIVNVKREKIHMNIFMFRDQAELKNNCLKELFVRKPVLLARDPNDSMRSLYYLQNKMQVPIHLVIKQPEIIVRKPHFLALRHKFLVKLGRAQYDPKQPGYVSLDNLATMDDETFCKEIAMTDINVFHDFQKTL